MSNDVAKVVDGHVPVDTVVGQGGRHDAPAAVVDEYVEPVRVMPDGLGHLLGAPPVAQVALHPGHAVGLVLAQLVGDGPPGSVKHVFGGGDDVHLGQCCS